MHTAEHHYHGGDVWSHTWSSQTFAQLAHQYEQRPATRFSDVPTVNGHLSDVLKHKLAEEELLDMEVLLRYRGIRRRSGEVMRLGGFFRRSVDAT